VGVGYDSSRHRHLAVQMGVALGGSLWVAQDTQTEQACAGFVVSPNIAHTVKAAGMTSVFVWTESLAVTTWLRREPGLHLLPSEVRPLAQGLVDSLERDLPVYELDRLVLQALGQPALPQPHLDPRVQAALEALREPDFTFSSSIAGLAAHVQLSPSRLRHLFQAQVGVSFSRYRVWQRLMAAVRASASGATLTEAAHAAGFADSAHLSRTYRATFGLKPSQVFGNRLVQVKLRPA